MERPTGCGATICCDPYRRVYRFVALFFICFVNFGSYYCYDNPAALVDNFKNDAGISGARFNWLYSIYSWPNVVLSLLGGFFIDRVLGVRLGGIIFSSLIMLGQIVFATGVLVNAFWLMMLGRFIFACGGENLSVAQNVYCSKWFRGKELTFVFGVSLSFARIGSTVNMVVMKPIYALLPAYLSGYRRLGSALMIAALSAVVSFGCALILAAMDRRNDRFLKAPPSQEQSETDEAVVDQAPIEAPHNEEDAQIRVGDILKFPLTMWLLCVLCVFYYGAIFPFIVTGVLFFESKYQLAPDLANTCNSLVYLISIGASPFWGALVDATGRNVVWMLIATVLTIFAHVLFAFTFVTPYIPMVIIGVAYSLLASSLWPSIAYIIARRCLATAFGVIQALQNLGLALIFMSTPYVLEARGFVALELYFLAFLCIALGSTLLLFFVDAAHGGVLNMNAKQRKEYLASGVLDKKTV